MMFAGTGDQTVGMKSKAHPKYKTKYRVANWSSYDRALVRRGAVTLWLAPEAIAAWEPGRVGTALVHESMLTRSAPTPCNPVTVRCCTTPVCQARSSD